MRWIIKDKPEESKVIELMSVLKIDKEIAELLLQKGIDNYDDAKKFFRPDINLLHDPYLMKDMDKAVKRVLKALDNEEEIMVYGDYDVDGTTSVAMMSSFLESVSQAEVESYIPDRYKEGYGISFLSIDYAYEKGYKLIIALDCGIKAIDKVKYANERGIDFIICDHHLPGKEVPDALAVLDPKQVDCYYPFKELSGCGVGFKLVEALATELKIDKKEIIKYTDLLAISIGADIVPITGENRILAYYGLIQINTNPRPGIKVLKKLQKKEIMTITDVVFGIAPKINAAGRIKHGIYAVELLKENDEEKATAFAEKINEYNTFRKDLDRDITKEALAQIQENEEENRSTNVVYSADWHKGVIGIVASRLIETHYKPTLVFCKSGDYLVASARSVKGFDVHAALEACSEYLDQFGGHKYAAGMSIKPENYQKLKDKFESIVKATIPERCKTPEVSINLELPLTSITPKFYRVLQQFAPFGPGNMHPVFVTKNLKDRGYSRTVGEDKTHLKISVVNTDDENGLFFDVIGFGLGSKIERIKDNDSFDVAYCLDENIWNGNRSIQMMVKDVK